MNNKYYLGTGILFIHNLFILRSCQMQHLMLDCCFKFPIAFMPASLYLATNQEES